MSLLKKPIVVAVGRIFNPPATKSQLFKLLQKMVDGMAD